MTNFQIPGAMLLVAAVLLSSNLISGQEVTASSSCCPQVFLSSSDLLADKQAPALGIFTLANQKIANNSHPVYVKHANNQDFFLYFRQSDQSGGSRVVSCHPGNDLLCRRGASRLDSWVRAAGGQLLHHHQQHQEQLSGRHCRGLRQ